LCKGLLHHHGHHDTIEVAFSAVMVVGDAAVVVVDVRMAILSLNQYSFGVHVDNRNLHNRAVVVVVAVVVQEA